MGIELIIITLVLGLLTAEALAYLPRFQRALLEFAIRLLPPDQRTIRFEEWHADILEFTGELTRTVRALGFVRAGITFRSGLVWEAFRKKARLYVPILNQRSFGVMAMSDLIRLMHQDGVTIEDYDTVETMVKGKKRHTTKMVFHYRNPADCKPLWQMPGASPAWHPWQLSAPVWFLRRTYSAVRYAPETIKKRWSRRQ